MKLPAIDKQAHFLAGYCISVSVGLLTSPVEGLMLAAVAGLMKEVVDAVSEKGTPDVWDLVYTAAGGGVAYLFLIAV